MPICNSQSNITIPLSTLLNIDVAVLNQDYAELVVKSKSEHVADLDAITITESLFREIFYPHGETFGINNTIRLSHHIIPYISFLPQIRTMNGESFFLADEIYDNIEKDLNVSRDCFTADSLVSLHKEILSIKTLCDVNNRSAINSLTWDNIISIARASIKQSNDMINQYVNTLLIVNVVFKTPTPSVNPTTIRFRYRTTITVPPLDNNK